MIPFILFAVSFISVACQPDQMIEEKSIFKKRDISLPEGHQAVIVQSSLIGSSVQDAVREDQIRVEQTKIFREQLKQKTKLEIEKINADPTKTYKAQYNAFGSLTQEQKRQLYLTLTPSSSVSLLYQKYITDKQKEKLTRGVKARSSLRGKASNQTESSPPPNETTKSFVDKINIVQLKQLLAQQNLQYFLKQRNISQKQGLGQIIVLPTGAQSNDNSNRTLRLLQQLKKNGTQPQNTLIVPDKRFNVDWSCISGKVRAQGGCGACYAFSTVNSVSSAFAIYDYTFYFQLSAQQLASCGRKYDNFLLFGCRGGYLQGAFSYVKIEGLFSEFNYPYKQREIERDKTNQCRPKSNSIKKWNILDHGQIRKGSCEQLRNQLQRQPISIAVTFYKMQYYKSGVFNDCQPNQFLDHAVLLVGYQAGVGWKIKNSWGIKWGEEGYAWIDQFKNCKICDIAMYPILDGQAGNNFKNNLMLRKCPPPNYSLTPKRN